MLVFMLLLSALSAETTVGVPVQLDYRLPSGWEMESLISGEQWQVVSQDSGIVELIPLDLDTLDLPVLQAWYNGDTLLLQPPELTVMRTMPDTSYVAAVFQYPALLDIPAGFPSDYLLLHRFWLVWGGPPGFNWLLAGIIAAAAAVLLLTVLLIVRRRRKSWEEPEAQPVPPDRPSDEALALLESSFFNDTATTEIYTDVDRLLRNTIDWKFGIANRALTYGQVTRRIRREPGGKRFQEEADPLMQEISLQRYADWGSSRDRAQRFVRLLARIMEEWL
jgi:hypothetical protein